MRVLFYDTKLIQVLEEIYTPSAKAAVPTARVEFPSSMADAQKKTAFAFRIRCLLAPGLCTTPEDVLPWMQRAFANMPA